MMRHEMGRLSMMPPVRTNTVETRPWDSWQGLLLWGQEELAGLGLREARTSAEYLLEEASGLKCWQIRLRAEEKPAAALAEKYCGWIEQRRQRVPAAYVTGKAYFRDESLDVGPDCLVPRPETELLVEAVIQGTGFETARRFEFLDLGTGSGAIAVSLLKYFPNASAVMADISSGALRAAGQNAERCGVAGRCQILTSDFFSAFQSADLKKAWPVIVSNPPYLAEADWQRVEPELLYEPRVALDGGRDGLDAYRRIAREAGDFLEQQGMLFLEVGQGQSSAVRGLLLEQHFTDIRILKDFSGIDRIVTASSPPRL